MPALTLPTLTSANVTALTLLAALPLFGTVLVPEARAQFLQPGQGLESSISYSGSAAVRRVGESDHTALTSSKLSYSYATVLDQGNLLGFRVGCHELDFSLPDQSPLPDRLTSVSLSLVGSHRFDEQWTAFALLSPGFYFADSHLSGKSFNVPLGTGVLYSFDKDTRLSAGVAYNHFSRYEVLPFLGFSHTFSPEWSLNLGFPDTSLAFKPSERLTFKLLVSAEAGSFYVRKTDSFQAAKGALSPNGLRNTYLDFRELREGIGADYVLPTGAKLSLEVGLTSSRRWDFHDYGVRYDGRPSAYGRLSVNARF